MSRRFLLLAVLTVPTFGCSEARLTEGLEEPLALHDAQFLEGELPGRPPLTTEEILDGVAPKSPTATAPSTDTVYVSEGLAGTQFYGLVTDDAVSIAVRVKDAGSGYWVLPAGPADPTQQGFLGYNFIADLHASLPPGRHDLLIAAVDADGSSGTQAVTSLCVNSLVPDNGNACTPTIQPPDLVVSLSWDAPVDLDFVIVTPSGKIVNSKNPTTAEPDENGQTDPTVAGVGNLDFDSNKDCVIDGRQRENLVFQTVPRRATYHLYANLSRACDEKAVRYELSYHGRIPGEEDGTFAVETSPKAEGTLIAPQANGGSAIGTFVTDLKIGN